MLVKIIEVRPKVEREYIDNMGQKQVFRSVGMLLHNGQGNMYVEAVQEMCTRFLESNVKAGYCMLCEIQPNARKFNDSKGGERYSNELTLKSYMLI